MFISPERQLRSPSREEVVPLCPETGDLQVDALVCWVLVPCIGNSRSLPLTAVSQESCLSNVEDEDEEVLMGKCDKEKGQR
jgi:hypothetical protein